MWQLSFSPAGGPLFLARFAFIELEEKLYPLLCPYLWYISPGSFLNLYNS